jgi:transposase InsO family protein
VWKPQSKKGALVTHANARLTPLGRKALVDRVAAGWTITRAADAARVSRQTGSKWVKRYRTEGVAGLADRSSAAHRQVRAHPAELVEAICARRLELRAGPHVLAWEAGLARSTVYAFLARRSLNRLDRLEPKAPVVRYERERPGELVHLDTKQLGRIGKGGGHRVRGVGVKDKFRGIGWNRVHIAIDDHSRLAYAEELADESPATTAAFLHRAFRFYAGHGITIERILTDNGGCYRSDRFAEACDELGIGHRFTRPYRPQTNGKAERMVRTLLSEWAYARPFTDTDDRIALLAQYLDFYNRRRPHWSLNGQPPISRAPVNNATRKNS